MELLLPMITLKGLLPLLAVIAGIFVITTKNAIISVFNLIVLYILVAFYLIYIGVTYLGISYIIIYIGAIAILFLFIIMMIDVEVVEKRGNNYLPLLFLLLSGFLLTMKKILYSIGLVKMKSLTFKEEKILLDDWNPLLFSLGPSMTDKLRGVRDSEPGLFNQLENYVSQRVSVFLDSKIAYENMTAEEYKECKDSIVNSFMYEIHENNENNERLEKIEQIMTSFDLVTNETNQSDLIQLVFDIRNVLHNSIDECKKYIEDSQINSPYNSINFVIMKEDEALNELWTKLDNEIEDDHIINRVIDLTKTVDNINSEWKKNKFTPIIEDSPLSIYNKVPTIIENKNFNRIIEGNYYVSFNYGVESGTNYLLVAPDWDSAASRITQISAIGDVLYTVYHSYIYILSVILLLGMVGAIILTADSYQEIKIINISKNKYSSILSPYYLIKIKIKIKNWSLFNIKNIWFKLNYNYYNLNHYIIKIKEIIKTNVIFIVNNKNSRSIISNYIIMNNNEKLSKLDKLKIDRLYNIISKKCIAIPSFSYILNPDNIHSEGITGNLLYFIIANIIIALLLLAINSYFSLSVKYLEKGGGFECGFTSFVQTRERFNVIFYRVSLLFLVFDLEIILAFPYTAIYQKNQNISKNNVLAFLYILIVGFIYELKEGALNIVKKAHPIEINIQN